MLKQDNFTISSPGRANPNLKIAFYLIHPGRVSVKVYTLSGREIVTVVNGNFGAGVHNLTWNTRKIAHGCYSIRMQAGPNLYVKSIPVF